MMPWTANDAERFKKGLSAKQKRQWAAVANSTLAECMEVRNDEKACAGRAVRAANGSVGKKKEG